MSYWTFAHVLALDMQFHLQRRTGSLSRMIERGTTTKPQTLNPKP